MNDILYAVVLRQNGDCRYVLQGRTRQPQTYLTVEEAFRGAQRYSRRITWRRLRQLGIELRVIPVSPEGALADIWTDYKHLEVT